MYTINYYNLQEFCRICLKQLKISRRNGNENKCSYNLQSLPHLALLLKIYFSLDIFKQPQKFPNSICEMCYTTVVQCQQLQEAAQKSELELQRIVKENDPNFSQIGVAQHTSEDEQLLLPELLLPTVDIKSGSIDHEAAHASNVDYSESQATETTNTTNTINVAHSNENKFKLELNYATPNDVIKSEPLETLADVPEQQQIGDKFVVKEELQLDDNDNDKNYNDDYKEDNDDDDDDGDNEDDDYDDNDDDEEEIDDVDYNDNDYDSSTMDMLYSSSADDTMFPNIDPLSASKKSANERRNNRKTFRCNHCNKQAYKLVYLEAHIRSVHEGHEKPFLCQKCEKAFTRYNQLNDHTRVHHPSDMLEDAIKAAAELICKLCQRQYSSKRALREHLKRHAQIKEYVCKYCGVGKVTRTELLVHLRTHEPNLEKFKCTLCPQLFNHKNAISRHVRVVHEGERRFKCNYCNKGFGTRNSQERHELLHSNNRPYSCDVCNKGFTHIDRLTRHMHCHDKTLWKFICSYCDKPCMTRRNWLVHERRHTSDKPHICTICSKGFATDQDLSSHKQTPCMQRYNLGPNATQTLNEETLLGGD